MSAFFKFDYSVLKWIRKDLVYPHFKGFLTVFFLDILGILGQLTAYGLLLKYVNALESTNELFILGTTYIPQSSQTILTLVAVSTGALFVFYGLMVFWSKVKVIKMTKNYELFCSERVLTSLKAILTSPESSESEVPSFDQRRLRKALIKDSRFCGKLIPTISFSVITILKFLGSLVFMFSSSFLLTVIILLIVLPLLLVLKYMAKSVVNLTQQREVKLPNFIAGKKLLMQNALDPTKKKSSNTHHAVSIFYNTYYKILNKMALSDLIITFFTAILLVIVVLMAGNLVLFGDMSWPIFIAYIVALRYFFGSLKSLNQMFKKSSKIYDYVSHYVSTLKQIETGKGVPVLAAYRNNGPTAGKNTDGLGLDLDDDEDDDDDDF
ncbi:MAG: ABC-type multidrug transport system fused ATPase/permease subunit [Roseivirga sp.]|jgi:ABC-type multidrug transport system fused ATPase/permease subunit